MKRIVVAVGVMLCCMLSFSEVSAQNNSQKQGQQQYKEVPNPEKTAKRMTDDMQKLLNLTDKQYKKIYKLNLSEQKTMVSNMEKQQSSGNGPGMNGGMPPMDGQGGGMPPMGQGGPGDGNFGGQRPPMPPSGSNSNNNNDMQKQIEKKNKQIKKILTDEQYKIWTSSGQGMQNGQGQRPNGQGQQPNEQNRQFSSGRSN